MSGSLKVVLVDDEQLARDELGYLLGQVGGVDVVGQAGNGVEALTTIDRLQPDVVFLDIQMPGLTGFEVARRMLERRAASHIIFVTAYDQHAIEAFEVNAVDYLLKPFDDARFSAALQRAKAEVRLRQADTVNTRLTQLLDYLQQNGERTAGPAKSEGAGDRILLKSSGEIFFLKADEIDWIEAEGDYMKFHVGGRSHLMRETMARLEARLDPDRFIRIHRSTIVNLDRLRKLSPSFAGEYAVVLHDGTKLKLSRGYHNRVAELMKQAR